MAVIEQQNTIQEDFAALQDRCGHGWLRDLRELGMESFNKLGWPTLKHEEWRFTDVRPIANTPFALPRESGVVSAAELDTIGFGGISKVRLVFVDGKYRADLSRLAALPPSVQAVSLVEAIASGDPTLRHHLDHVAHTEQDPFDALNTAFIEDGAFIHIGKNAQLDGAIHLLYVTTAKSAKPQAACHPRNLIVADPGSKASVIEHYVALGDDVYFSNAVTEVLVHANAELHHYLMERESHRAYNISTLRVLQERDSRFESHTALLGGALVRNNVHVELRGTGCHSLINGLYLPTGTQHHDNHMRIVHGAERCDSRQFYKGVMSDKSSAAFSGRIVVEKGAQKTDAKQTNRNLLLSREATVNTKPQLEIYADDVKCTHGATTGQLDDEQLFYLRARGVSEEVAHGLLVYAFAHESLERMTLEPVRRKLEELMADRLPQPDLLRKLI